MAYPLTDLNPHGAPLPAFAGKGGLDPAASQQLVEAKKRRRKIDRAIQVASFNAWTAGGLAVLSLPFALFGAMAALTVLVLGVVSYVEFRGRKMLRTMDLRGPSVLAYNQLGFAALIILYAVVQLYNAAIGQGAYEETIAKMPELQAMLGSTGELIRKINIATYVLLILATLVFQGGMGLYYLTLRRLMHAYLDETPQWVLDVQRTAA